ncbi:MAG: replicative DNA helicase [Pirellulales bacterium]|nr:replicative DNA helicase [Pirellulales bacterium]
MATANRPRKEASPRVTSEILDRLPPHNLEAEKGVIGSLLIDPVLCDDVVMEVQSDDFYSDANRKLFEHVVAIHEQGKRVDALLLIDRLKQANELDYIGGMAYLYELTQVPTAANAVYYARIVADKATLRSLIHASTEILREAYDPTDEPRNLLNRAEEKIFAIHDQKGGGEVKPMQDVLIEAFDHIDKRLEHGRATGVPSHYADLDEMTGGLHESELVILAARPSMGKTAFATNIAEHVALKEKKPVLFVSLEMARLELAQRMLCSHGRIDSRKFRSGFISAAERGQLVAASAELSEAPLYIDDSPSRNVTEIAATGRRLKRRNGLSLIVIDYLQLIEPDNQKDQRQEQVAKIARRLKGLARELKVPVLCLAQLNRQAETSKENRPRLSHLRESGAIEQDADVVMFVHREEYYATRDELEPGGSKEHLKGLAEIIVAKQRNGPIGDVKLNWEDKYTRFTDRAAARFEEFNPF